MSAADDLTMQVLEQGQTAADIASAALLEAGRPDLAQLVQFFLDDACSFYLEPMDEVFGADLDLMQRAERLALEAIR